MQEGVKDFQKKLSSEPKPQANLSKPSLPSVSNKGSNDQLQKATAKYEKAKQEKDTVLQKAHDDQSKKDHATDKKVMQAIKKMQSTEWEKQKTIGAK